MPDLTPNPPPRLISIVCPCYNEVGGLGEFVRRISAVFEPAGQAFEIVFVNDGSTDGTLADMRALALAHDFVTVVNLSRNFGKEIAMTAGLGEASGDAVVVIDADLQDPPEVIPDFIAAYCEGYDVVYGRRTEREGETWMKKATAHSFYRVMQNLGPVRLPEDVGDFRLMSRRAVDALMQMPETHRFMKGLFAWIGFPSREIPYRRHPRFHGTTKWNYRKLIGLSIEGITSFSTFPLRVTSFLGLAIAVLAFVAGVYFFVRSLLYGDPVRGFPTLYVTILLLGGTQLLALGIIGEYLGRVFNETKRRPLYFVESVVPARRLVGDDSADDEMRERAS
ncbi:MAG: glycosyltransferase family 2 protein [Rhodobacteraceae bacterium]|nr:glycosyltransferase family 2 protein [Paracoccaceae bacterium]